MTQPRDQAIRDAAASELGTSFFLEAGAGTGKTTILVSRVLEIVRSGAAQISEVVVITFTEKAAGELRGRIRADLHRQAEASDGEVRQRFLTAVHTLDAAHIETIHAFASSILRERPLEAAVDPNFQQLDEVGDELDFEERWRDWIWSVGGEELKAVERCLLLDLSLEEIRRVARWLMEYRDVDAAMNVPAAPNPAITLKRLLTIRESARPDVEQCLNPEGDGCFKRYSWVAEALDALSECRPSALEPELNRLQIKANSGNLKNWPHRDVRQRVLDAVEEMAEVLTEFQAGARSNALAGLANALTGFVRDAARGRIAESKLNFEDLLIEARGVIAGNDEVRRYLQQRYKFLLVDEFQDTDPIQAEMLFLLAAREDTLGAAPAWTDVTLEPGKLFLVGDPKQSIYRFRRADIAAFMKAKEVYERQQREGRPARVESISQNFRSVPEVVDWVNELFSGIIGRNPGLPFAQPEYEAIEAFREAVGEPRVIHFYPAEDVGNWRIDPVRTREAEAIARLIDCMVSDQGIGIADRKRGGAAQEFRGIRFKDICILIENRTKIEIYTDALEARRIPYVLDGGREFFQRQEVKDIAAMLRAMDDPSDSVSLVAALKSEAFACSDVELLQYRVNGGRFHIFADPIDGDSVSAALEQMKALHNEKAHHSMPVFVDRVVRESFLVESKLLDINGRQRAANLRLIVQRAVDFAANEVDSLRPFIRWISERQRESSQETESQVNESDDDVVRITTVHSAKGLEFPVIILAKLASGQAPSRDYRVVDRESSTLEFQVGSEYNRFSTPGFEQAWQTESLYEEAEQKRLLYVAATRAMNYLVVPIYKPEESPGKHVHLRAIPSWSQALGDPDGSTFAGARVLLDDKVPDRSRPAEEPPELPADLVSRWHKRMETIKELAQAGPRYLVPSRLADDEVKLPRETEPKDRSEDESDPDFQTDGQHALGFADGAAGNLFVGSSNARTRGSLVHEVLFRCDLSEPSSVVVWANRICRERGALELVADVTKHAKAILESTFMKERVLRSRNVLKELPVATFDGQDYVEGIADLAFEEADGWVVIDYKTDALRADREPLIRRYRPQLDAYRRALSAAGMKVKEAGLWFSESGDTWTSP